MNFINNLKRRRKGQATIEYLVLFITFALACAVLLYCTGGSESQNPQWNGRVRNIFASHFENMVDKILEN